MQHTWFWASTAADLGEAAKQARAGRGWRQDELAELVGVERNTLSRLENGKPVSTETALRALSMCGMTLVVVPKGSRVRVDPR